jgi:metal-responsive CopG/Arc/MetJ family transcriptional regulator
VPRVKVKLPDELLQIAATQAQELSTRIDDLYTEAIGHYVESNKNVSPGAVQSRIRIPYSAPQLTVEIPEELFQQADKLAKRLGKRREVLYSEALAKHLVRASGGTSALDQGHDLPSGAWRPKSAG